MTVELWYGSFCLASLPFFSMRKGSYKPKL